MNEDYMKQFRRVPDASFVEKIHSRIERKERRQGIKRYLALSALVLIIAFGMVMTFSSTVRADVLQTIEEIAGLRFDVTTNYPGDLDGEVTIVRSEDLLLAEAQTRFPSPVVLPTYIPQGYTRRENVLLTPFTNPAVPTLMIIWENNKSGAIILDILHCSIGLENCGLTVGEGALEEITVNGKPTVVVRGAWNYDTKHYDSSFMTALRWIYDENTIYALSTSNQDMPLEELVRMAESIP
jgi:hypothetical protein